MLLKELIERTARVIDHPDDEGMPRNTRKLTIAYRGLSDADKAEMHKWLDERLGNYIINLDMQRARATKIILDRMVSES